MKEPLIVSLMRLYIGVPYSSAEARILGATIDLMLRLPRRPALPS